MLIRPWLRGGSAELRGMYIAYISNRQLKHCSGQRDVGLQDDLESRQIINCVAATIAKESRKRRRRGVKRVDYQAMERGVERFKDDTDEIDDEVDKTAEIDDEVDRAAEVGDEVDGKKDMTEESAVKEKKNSSGLPHKRRRIVHEFTINEDEERHFKNVYTQQKLIKAQRKDPHIRHLWKIKTRGEMDQCTKQEQQDAANLAIYKGVIVRKEITVTGEIRKRIVVPLSMQADLVKMIHELNHPGVNGTIKRVKQYYWFRGMKSVIKDVVHHCEKCIARKGRTLRKETMSPDERPLTLGGRWHLDGLELPPSGGYDHLMVATDVATKYVILRPSKGETASAASNLVFDIIRRFGRPQEITTDKGRAFMSELFLKTCEGNLIKFKPIGVGRPQGNGMAERVNKTLLDALSIMCEGKGSKWAQHIGEVEYALNTRVSSVTGYTPYELVFGRLPPSPVYRDILADDNEQANADDSVKILRERINALQQAAHENQLAAAKAQRTYHDAKAQTHKFEVGDIVWLYNKSSVERGVTTKLASKWNGPYIITKAPGDVTYILADENGKTLPGTYHARYLYKPSED